MKLKPILLGIVISLGLTASCTPAYAQDPTPSPWSIASYYDIRTRESSVVVLRSLGQVKQPLGFKFDLDLEAFAGSNLQGDALAGVALTSNLKVAENVDFKFGLGTTWQPSMQLKDAGVGLILGLSYRF